jgi:hypothetical protein
MVYFLAHYSVWKTRYKHARNRRKKTYFYFFNTTFLQLSCRIPISVPCFLDLLRRLSRCVISQWNSVGWDNIKTSLCAEYRVYIYRWRGSARGQNESSRTWCTLVKLFWNKKEDAEPTLGNWRSLIAQEIPLYLRKSKIHYRVHKNPLLESILSQLDLVHILKIVLPSTPMSSKCPLYNNVSLKPKWCISCSSYACFLSWNINSESFIHSP